MSDDNELIFTSVTMTGDLTSCQQCKHKYNHRFRYCPFCGAQPEKPANMKDLLCPHCDIVMEKVMEIESIIDFCPNCEGVFCENDELEEITRERDLYKMDDIPRKFLRKNLPEAVKYIKCPICQKVMNRVNFKGISNVIIDVCYDHGVWLDSGELEAIRSFIANGGIDKAQNRDIIKNRYAIEMNTHKVNEARSIIRTMNRFNMKRIALNGF